MDELKPCPFCGGHARLVYAPYLETVYIECDHCTAMIGRFGKRVSSMSGVEYFTEESKAVEAWNRRMNDGRWNI